MTTNPPVDNKAKDAAAAVPAPDFSSQMHVFWEKNRTSIYTFAVVVLLAIVGREGWDYFNAQREAGIRAEYSKASETPEKLSTFATEYSSHPLAGLAWLRVADAQYTNRDFKSAATSYQRAVGILTDNSLKSRARLGAAICLLAGGDVAGGEAALKPLAADTGVDKVVRSETYFHLATIASEAGRSDDVRKFTDEITKIDPMGVWAQRAFTLRASLVTNPKAPEPATPVLSLTPGK
jgi:predicted negative regulator of RcsB-dependent stress response